MAAEDPPLSSPCIVVDHDSIRVMKERKHSSMVASERGQGRFV